MITPRSHSILCALGVQLVPRPSLVIAYKFRFVGPESSYVICTACSVVAQEDRVIIEY